MTKKGVKNLINENSRYIESAVSGDDFLGPLKELPGVWKNDSGFEGRGWNMTPLPFIAAEEQGFDYRILMNQYNEELTFDLVDKGVPNRGVDRATRQNFDQGVVTIDYEQVIAQIVADDFPASGKAGKKNKPIHHEPGLFLHMLNFETDAIGIARLGNIPHGDTVLALGRWDTLDGAPDIADIDTLPIGATRDLENPYLAPYRHYRDNPFEGLFNILDPSSLLRSATPSNVKATTVLHFDTKMAFDPGNVVFDNQKNSGGVINIPFIVKHANATDMSSTFWLMELDEDDGSGNPIFVMQYMQTVMLDFFDRRDGNGRIRWPHVSFNTMRRHSIPSQ